ncbi:ATP-binding protein [Streptomyces sp. NPDC051322]|uniref:ATP-binding protein n=1 Tax=Streptomyces sp. NPDC051322 TaxID=3154645 RepID=UPI00344FC2BF
MRFDSYSITRGGAVGDAAGAPVRTFGMHNAAAPQQTPQLRLRARSRHPRHPASPPAVPAPTRSLRAPRTRRAVITLPAEECRVRTVRRFVSALLTQWSVVGDAQDRAVLIVSELAANAAQHGRTDMTVALCLVGRALHVDVVDSGEPTVTRTGPTVGMAEDEHGRGLDMVTALADWTEMQRQPTGWHTRARLHTAPASSPAAL